MKNNQGNGVVYLLHFNQKYHHAQHYVGMVENEDALDQRLRKHANNHGANIVRVVQSVGIHFTLARTWKTKNPEGLENSIKKAKNTPRLCPFCNPNAHRRRKNG